MQGYNEGGYIPAFLRIYVLFLLTICYKGVRINKVIIEIDSAFQQKNSRKIF